MSDEQYFELPDSPIKGIPIYSSNKDRSKNR